MEEKKRKFNFHAEIDMAAERLNVSIDKGNPNWTIVNKVDRRREKNQKSSSN